MYELYVVYVMQEQDLEKADEIIGYKTKLGNNSGNGRISIPKKVIDNSEFVIGDEVHVLSDKQHQELINNLSQIGELQQELEDSQKQLHKEQESIEKLKSNIAAEKDSFDKLQSTIKKQKTTISHQGETIDSFNGIKTTLESEIAQLKDNNAEKDATIKELKSRIDELGKELDNAVDSAKFDKLNQELQDKDNEIAQLKDELSTAETNFKYWKKSYENLIGESDEVVARNESLISDNEKLRIDNNAINETNKLLNENLIAANNTFNETKQELQSDFKNKEKELKETIEKQQLHIDELTEKYQSLLILQDNIPQKQHYDEIDALKDKIKDSEKQIDKISAEYETKLATLKSELEVEHTNEKAQMLVVYNTNLNNLKHEKNNIAAKYNDLLDEVGTLTKWNTTFHNHHKKILENKTPLELEVIASEHLPAADETTLEYVPKE